MRLQVMRLATFISLALRFCFVFLFLYFQVFYAKKKKTTHYFYNQKENLYKKEKTQLKRQITVEKYL